LLRELRRLRRDESAQQADSEGNSPQKHLMGPLA
jgi:hypothetical protein